MKKNEIGEKRQAPEWSGEAHQSNFIGWMSALLVFALVLLGLFILFGFPS